MYFNYIEQESFTVRYSNQYRHATRYSNENKLIRYNYVQCL